eukprot:7477641-Alexandrium_andersonii.AAC.1
MAVLPGGTPTPSACLPRACARLSSRGAKPRRAAPRPVAPSLLPASSPQGAPRCHGASCRSAP